MRTERLLVLCAALVGVALPAWLAVGCDRGGEGAKPIGSGATASAASQAGETSAAEYADEDLPVEADFEAEAEREITDESFGAVLGEIEKELDASVRDAAPDAGSADGGKGDGGRSDVGAKPGAEGKGQGAAKGAAPKGGAPKVAPAPYE
jgi:hypothetical protein